MKGGGINAFRNGINAAALAFLALFLLYPLWLVLRASVLDEDSGAFSLLNYAKILTSPYYLGSIRNSLVAGALATVFASLLGIPLAFCLARVEVPGKSVLMTLAALPLVVPSFVSAYALVLLFGHVGVVTMALRAIGIPMQSIYGMAGMVTVFVFTLYPYVLMPTIAGFKAVDISIEESARNLGASRFHAFRTVLLPVVMPAIFAGGLLVFIETLENFGVPAVLAEDRPFVALDIFKLFAGESDSNVGGAGALSLLLILCTSAVLLLQRHYLAQRRFAMSTRRAPPSIPLSRGWLAAATLYCWGMVLLSVVPFMAVVLISFMQFRGPVMSWQPSLGNYAALLGRSYQPLYNTLILASVATLAATCLGAPIGYVLARHRGRLSDLVDMIGMVPFAVSGTVLGIGLVIAFNSGWLVLTGGWLILVIAYVVRKLPFSIRSSSAIVHQIDPSLEEASISLGVSPLKTFLTLTVPLMLGGLVGGMVLIWVTAASELSSTIVLYSSRWATMTVIMFQALQGTGAGEATAAASILIIVTAVPLLIVYQLLRRHDTSLL